MKVLSPESLLAVQDATELAFHGVDFETIPFGDDEEVVPFDRYGGPIISGSGRIKDVFDPSVGCFVEVAEVYVLGRNKRDEVVPDHRLALEWDNGDHHEIALDDGEIVQDEADAEIIKDKVIKALSAATGIV